MENKQISNIGNTVEQNEEEDGYESQWEEGDEDDDVEGATELVQRHQEQRREEMFKMIDEIPLNDSTVVESTQHNTTTHSNFTRKSNNLSLNHPNSYSKEVSQHNHFNRNSNNIQDTEKSAENDNESMDSDKTPLLAGSEVERMRKYASRKSAQLNKCEKISDSLKSQVKRLTERLGREEEQNHRLINDLDSIRQHFALLRERDHGHSSLSVLRGTMLDSVSRDLENTRKELSQTRETLMKEKENGAMERDRLQAEVGALRKEQDKLLKEVAENNVLCQARSRRNAQLEKELEQLKQNIGNQESQREAEEKARLKLEARAEDAERKLVRTEEECEQLKYEKDRLQKDVDLEREDWNTQMQEKLNKINEMQNYITQMKKKQENLEEHINQMYGERETWEEHIRGADNAARSAQRRLEEEVESWKKQLNESEQQYEKRVSDLREDFSRERQELVEKVERHRNKAAVLQEQLNLLNDQQNRECTKSTADLSKSNTHSRGYVRPVRRSRSSSLSKSQNHSSHSDPSPNRYHSPASIFNSNYSYNSTQSPDSPSIIPEQMSPEETENLFLFVLQRSSKSVLKRLLDKAFAQRYRKKALRRHSASPPEAPRHHHHYSNNMKKMNSNKANLDSYNISNKAYNFHHYVSQSTTNARNTQQSTLDGDETPYQLHYNTLDVTTTTPGTALNYRTKNKSNAYKDRPLPNQHYHQHHNLSSGTEPDKINRQLDFEINS